MTLSRIESEQLAREMLAASESGKMVEPASLSRAGFDLDTAYEVEGILKGWRETAGHKPVGRKVGYANKAMWRVLKLQTLVWGHMYDDTVHEAKGTSLRLHVPHPRSLKIEPEIVFGVKRQFGGEASDAGAALAACDWLAIGFEIIDCPYPQWKFQPADFVASFGLHAALVVGERAPIRESMIPALIEQLPELKVKVFKANEFLEEGSGKNSLKNPALCLAELGAAIAKRFPGEPLSAGEIVSSGTLTAGHLIEAGDEWRVEVEGIDLPALSLRVE